MPRVVADYSDDRNKAWCIHCARSLSGVDVTRDHTPTKALLSKPYPDNLAITPVCKECNNGFSLNEEYLVTLLSAVLSGTTDPERQIFPHAGKSLKRSSRLRLLLESQKTEQFRLFGGSDVVWHPDRDRIASVIVKNARAHLFFENGEPMLDAPQHVFIKPINGMTNDELSEFFYSDPQQPWCEVGSRWNTRIWEGDTFDSQGFLVVQDGAYRFRVEEGGAGVKSVIREYLLTSVFW